MPRVSKGPWRRRQDHCWYTTVKGTQVKLAGAEVSREEAVRLYHLAHAGGSSVEPRRGDAVQAETKPVESPSEPEAEPDPRVIDILKEFLQWSKANQERNTYANYKWYIDKFSLFIDDDLLFCQLRVFHVDRWLCADFEKAGNNHRRGAIRTIKRALNWAVDTDRIDRNPISKLRLPSYERREGHLTQAQFDELLEEVTDECFRDYLRFLWLTGCRPQEIRGIEASNVSGERIVLPVRRSKGKKYNRVIYLPPEAAAIIRRLARRHPTGPLFRNQRDDAWTSNAVRCRFKRLKAVGICATLLRHSWVTRSLENGIDTTTVAILAGHRDTTMVQRNYQHLAMNHEHLVKAARRATGE